VAHKQCEILNGKKETEVQRINFLSAQERNGCSGVDLHARGDRDRFPDEDIFRLRNQILSIKEDVMSRCHEILRTQRKTMSLYTQKTVKSERCVRCTEKQSNY
jgi:pyridoxine 5'-phosphate synthase PdxJ